MNSPKDRFAFQKYSFHGEAPGSLLSLFSIQYLCSIFFLQKVNLCAWMVLLIAIPVILIGNHPYYQVIPTSTPIMFGLYETLGRNLWAISICYIIFACAHGSGGPVNEFLSLQMWKPLSRLSYCIYLIHYHLIGLIMGSMKTPPYFSAISAFQNFISVFVLSVFISIPLVLAFELPIDAIEKFSANFKNGQRICSTFTLHKWPKNQLCSIKIRYSDAKIIE